MWLKRLSILAMTAVLAFSATLPMARADEVSDHIEAAKSYMVGRQWDFASHEWRQALERDPNNLEATIGLAETLINAGFVKDAITFLTEAKASMKEPLVDLTLAKAYEKNKDIQSANDIYIALLEKDHYNPDIFRTALLLTQKAPKQKLTTLKQLLQTYGAQAKKEGEKALAAKNYLDASRYYEIAAIYYHKVGIINDYGVTLLLSGQNVKASQQFLILSKQKTVPWTSHANNALVFLSVGKINQAVDQMEQAISKSTNASVKAKLYNNLGYIYEGDRRYLQARHAYEHALQLSPTLTKARTNLAYVLVRQKEYEQATVVYKTLVAQNPNDALLWNRLGFAYEMQDEEKKALESYKRAVDINPRLKEAYFNLGALYKKLDKLTDSAEAYKRVSEIEFQEMENPQLAVEPQGISKVLSYIDVFYSSEGS